MKFVFDRLLFLLCDHGLLHIQYTAFRSVRSDAFIKDAHVFQVKRLLDDLVCSHALRPVCIGHSNVFIVPILI